jgi:hypothetical protein
VQSAWRDASVSTDTASAEVEAVHDTVAIATTARSTTAIQTAARFILVIG